MRKRYVIALALAVVALLVARQVHAWAKFDWRLFWQQISHARPLLVLAALGLIYLAYIVRSYRWTVLLKPVCQTSVARILGPTLIGFTGLALLGRPGELIRPYLIARKHDLSVSSQLAVWTVERILDVGGFAVLFATAILTATADLQSLPYFAQFRRAVFVLLAGVLCAALVAYAARRHGERIAGGLQRALAPLSHKLAHQVSGRALAFGEGLNTVEGPGAFLQLAASSLLMWFIIGMAYYAVIHAFPLPLQQMSFARVLLLMSLAMVGSLIQIPVVGGGQQLLVIAALIQIFHVPSELAVSCGMLLWITNFMAPVPVGLALLHRERLSLRRLSKQVHEPEPQPASPSIPVGPRV
jgi:glycosyltransferase 2 family protein